MPIFAPAVFQDSSPRFLRGGGEMGALMRNYVWSSSALGLPEQWPQTLRTVVCLLLNTRHPMYIFWGDASICFYNDAYRQSLSPERHPSSFGQPAREVWGEIWDEIGPQIEQVMSGGEATWHENALLVTTRYGRRDDVYWTYSYSPINQETAPNGIGGVLVVCSETTTAVEAHIREAQRIETLGRLAGGIAHDFNNLLIPIMGSIEQLANKLATDEKAQRVAAGAMQSAERAKSLVEHLLAFGRRQTLQTSVVSLATLIAEMRHQIDRTIGASINLTVDIPDDLPCIEVDIAQLKLAVLKLCANANAAMAHEGQLTISGRATALGSNDINRLVLLRITDTGHGMNRDTLERAIEPFYTTKGVGEGVGLGLSMVDGLAAQMGGKLELTSAIGSGTTAELSLPIATARAAIGADILRESVPTMEEADRAKTILLVDDEAIVRMAIADNLTDLGHSVIEAASGAEALSLMNDGLLPDMLVTDYRMPGMTGAALIREIRCNLPSLPVLMVTGYADLAPGETSDFDVLTKPFSGAELAVRVSALFGLSSLSM